MLQYIYIFFFRCQVQEICWALSPCN